MVSCSATLPLCTPRLCLHTALQHTERNHCLDVQRVFLMTAKKKCISSSSIGAKASMPTYPLVRKQQTCQTNSHSRVGSVQQHLPTCRSDSASAELMGLRARCLYWLCCIRHAMKLACIASKARQVVPTVCRPPMRTSQAHFMHLHSRQWSIVTTMHLFVV